MNAYGPRTVSRTRRTRAQIEALDETIIAILAEDAPLTLRHVYYGLVAADAIPKTEPAYGTVQRRLVALRESGRVPWRHVVDNTRWVHGVDVFDGPEAALRATAQHYRRDIMRWQPTRIEVWAESDSIGSVLAAVTNEFGCDLYIGRGYSSRGYLHSAAEQIEAAAAAGKRTLILHLGDYDPSGEDIARTVRETLTRYVRQLYQTRIMADLAAGFRPLLLPAFDRLAVTPEQIKELELPYRPVKKSDPRTRRFAGAGSVEIEAIPRRTILAILRDRIERELDSHALEIARVAEESERAVLARIAETMAA